MTIAQKLATFRFRNICTCLLFTQILSKYLQFDNLQHPGADFGMKLPCMLKFKHHKDKEVR